MNMIKLQGGREGCVHVAKTVISYEGQFWEKKFFSLFLMAWHKTLKSTGVFALILVVSESGFPPSGESLGVLMNLMKP